MVMVMNSNPHKWFINGYGLVGLRYPTIHTLSCAWYAEKSVGTN